MQAIILRENLKNALIKIERAVIDNNNLPILKNVFLDGNKTLTLSATNLELAIKTDAAAKIQTKGTLTIPFQPLFSIVSNSVSERIQLQGEGDNLLVKTDNYEAKIQGNRTEDFPIIPTIEERKRKIEISAEVLNSALAAVSAAAQVSELKPELSGILFDFQVGVLKLAATDSFRLAEKSILNSEFQTDIEQGFRAIIPIATTQEIPKIFNEDKIEIFFDDNQVLFQTKNSQIISRLIDGEYPDYQAIIPKSFETTITADRTDLINAIKLVSNFSGRTSDLKIKSESDAKTLEFYSSNQAVGENNYMVPVKKEGATIDEVSFNWRYLLAGLQSISSEQVIFGINGNQKPSILKPLADESMFYVVMPLES